MIDQTSSWDPSLLRKFSSTGHFRLLNQLRGDLRKKPLYRDQQTGELKRPGSLGKSQAGMRRQSVPRRASTPVTMPVTTQTDATPVNEPEGTRSFRDRLNEVEMR